MSSDKDIYQKIKDSFESQQSAPPKDLWENLTSNLDVNESDKLLDDKVKDSYEESTKAAPDHAWSGINRQLNIDKVWIRTKKALDVTTRFRKWSKAAAAILFLLVLPAVMLNQLGYLQLSASEPTAEAELICGNYPESNWSKPIQISGPVSNEVIIPDNHQNNVGKQAVETVESNIQRTESIQPKEISTPNEETLIAFTENPEPLRLIEVKGPVLLQNNLDVIYPDLTTDDDYFVPKEERELHKWELGVIYNYNNTWVVNNNTRNSFNPESLITTEASFAGSYGMQVNYKLNNSSQISTDFYIGSGITQRYYLYDEGKYLVNDIVLNYSELSASYKRKLWYSAQKTAHFNYKLGAYHSLLHTQQSYVNNVLSAEYMGYNKSDYGLRASVGFEKYYGRLILDYGANFKYGIKNIFDGSEKISKKFNITKNRLAGAYISLRYKI